MKIVCPNCGVSGSAELFLQDTAAREAVAWALAMPAPLAKLLLGYIGLFRPTRSNSLSWDRVAKLLGELKPMFDAGSVRKKGRDWPVTTEIWQQALSDMLDRRDHLVRPLKNHNYLLEIVVGLADKAEGQAEQKREQGRQHAHRDGTGMTRVLNKEADESSDTSKPPLEEKANSDENELAWVRQMIQLKALQLIDAWADRMRAAGRIEVAEKGEALLREATNGS